MQTAAPMPPSMRRRYGALRRTETRRTGNAGGKKHNTGGKTYRFVQKKRGTCPSFLILFSFCGLRRRAGHAFSAAAFGSLPPAAFICAHARYASSLPPCAALCRAVHSPPVRSAADLLVNVILVAVGIRLHAHVITLRRAAAAHADADDLFAAHRFALEIENTAFAAFAGSHF